MEVRILRAVRAWLLCATVLLLGSCNVLEVIFGSVFPGTVTLLKAQQNLSGAITVNDDSGLFTLRAFTAGASAYVVLSGTTAADGNVMFFYDGDLNGLVKKVTLGGTQTSYGVFADSTGQVVAGTELFSSDLSTVAPFVGGADVRSGPGVGVDAFYSSASSTIFQVVSFGTSSMFQYDTWPGTFSPATGAATGPVSVPLSTNPSTSLQVEAVLDDGSPGGNAVIVVGPGFVNGNQPPGTSYFLTIAKSSFGAGSVPANLVDTAPHRDGLDPDSFGFEDGKILAYDTSSSSYVAIDPGHRRDREQLLLAYRPPGHSVLLPALERVVLYLRQELQGAVQVHEMVVRRMRGSCAAAVGLLLLNAACAAHAQAAAADQPAPRRILVSFQKAFLSGYSDEEIGVLKQAFLLVLSQADGAPSPVDYGQRAFPSRSAARDKAARDLGADCWLLATFEGSRARPRIHVLSHDLLYTTSMDFTVFRRGAVFHDGRVQGALGRYRPTGGQDLSAARARRLRQGPSSADAAQNPRPARAP